MTVDEKMAAEYKTKLESLATPSIQGYGKI